MFAKKVGLMAGSTRYYPSHLKKDLTPVFEELKEKGASLDADQIPTIVLDLLDNVPYFHIAIIEQVTLCLT